jgi:hypothetical protein
VNRSAPSGRRNFTRQPCRLRRVTAEPTPLDPAPPVFGRRDERAQPVRTRRFGLEVEYRKRGKLVREDLMLTAYTTVDAGGILRLMQAADEMEQANATAFVLSTSLLDDDGVPSTWEQPDEDDPMLVDEDDPDSPAMRGEPTEIDPGGPLLYERWDGEPVPWDDLAFDEYTEGSSRRRFAFVMTSPLYRVELSALLDTSQWLVAQGSGRPTKRPASSGRGPSSTRRGYAGRSR